MRRRAGFTRRMLHSRGILLLSDGGRAGHSQTNLSLYGFPFRQVRFSKAAPGILKKP